MDRIPAHPNGDQEHSKHESHVCAYDASQADIFPENQLRTRDGRRENRIDGPTLNFLRDKSYSHKDGDHHADKINCGQPQVINNASVLSYGERPEQSRCSDEEQCEQNKVVQYLVPNRFSERIASDGDKTLHLRLSDSYTQERSPRVILYAEWSRQACLQPLEARPAPVPDGPGPAE